MIHFKIHATSTDKLIGSKATKKYSCMRGNTIEQKIDELNFFTILRLVIPNISTNKHI